MLGLKPHTLYGDCMSESKDIYASDKHKIDIQQYYGRAPYLKIFIWRLDIEGEHKIYTLKRSINIPLSLYSFYIQFIYIHLGRCHPNLRSKFYIGRPVEKIYKGDTDNEN